MLLSSPPRFLSPRSAAGTQLTHTCDRRTALLLPLLLPAVACADDAIGRIADEAGYLPPAEAARLERITAALEADTGVRLRVRSTRRKRDAESLDAATDLDELKRRWRVGSSRGGVSPNAIVILADRGTPGALEAGSSFLRFEVGDDLQVSLPGVFWGRLQREYGKNAFVQARGEAASIVRAVEVVVTCLRSEEAFCTDVPRADSSYF